MANTKHKPDPDWVDDWIFVGNTRGHKRGVLHAIESRYLVMDEETYGMTFKEAKQLAKVLVTQTWPDVEVLEVFRDKTWPKKVHTYAKRY